ncbi:unnamed protein product, partial [Polarella glacialis]
AFHGPPLSELCAAASARAEASGLVQAAVFQDRKQLFVGGVCMEVWTNARQLEAAAQMRAAYGDGQAARVDAELEVCSLGQEKSHMVLLHPEPITAKHVVLVLRRHAKEVTVGDEAAEAAAIAQAAADPQASGAEEAEPAAEGMVCLEDFVRHVHELMHGDELHAHILAKVAVSATIRPLWPQICEYLVCKGAIPLQGTAPKGPLVRRISKCLAVFGTDT